MTVPARGFADIKADHVLGYRSSSDEAWERDPICRSCEVTWPCDTALVIETAETMRGDVHHRLNPVIGLLRYGFERAVPGTDPATVPLGTDGLPDLTGLPREVAFDTATLVSTVQRLTQATDAADAALGEEPMRDQIAMLQARLAGGVGA